MDRNNYPGDTIELSAVIHGPGSSRFAGRQLASPTGGVQVSIWDPDNTELVTAQATIEESTGKVYYDYLLPSDAPTGTYWYLFHATGSQVKRAYDTFEVSSTPVS